MTTSLIRAVVMVGLVVWIAGCGGGGDDPAASPGVETIGAAGGTALGGDGAQVVFPKDALRGETTVRIAKDSTGAPPLPAGAAPAGAVYMITPHGETFAVHAEVSIPVEVTDIADNQQLLLVTAEPGDTQWRVLSGATYGNGVLRAPVMHFSFFQAIVLTNLSMPSLTTIFGRSIGMSNNVGGAGIGRISPDFEFNQNSWLQYSNAYLQARLTFPLPPLSVRSGLPSGPPPRTCLPTSLGHTGAAWRFLRNNTQIAPDVVHFPIVQGAESSYPRFENEISSGGLNNLYSANAVPGFGAVLVYGQDAPRRGAFAPAGSTDVWALPPAGNSVDNDLLMWSGFLLFDGEKHNGRMRIETTIATDCNLLIEAVPISFQLNLASRIPAWQPYTGVQALDSTVYVPNGLTAVLPFAAEVNGATLSIAWEFSHDAVNWEKLPVPPQYIRDDGPSDFFRDRFPQGHNYSIVIPNVQITQAGWYRAWACSTPIAADPPAAALPSLCVSKAPIRLVVLTERPTVTAQPAPQIVQVGQTASFTVGFTVGFDSDLFGGINQLMDYRIKWQKRGLVEAAFGLGTWTDIDGADYRTYTTPPTTVNDTATLYRAVATSVLGSTASDAALLTVVEQLAPPVVQSQPGNLNVSLGGNAVFAATVSGTAPLSYQWRRNGSNLIGANAAILTLANVSGLDAGSYDLMVTNRAGSVTSEAAVLVVTQGVPVPLAPTIAASPASITVAEGNAANFAVSVNGTGPYTYLWMKNGVPAPIPGGDLPSFGIAAVSTTDAGTYSVRVTNSIGTVVSAAATLTVSAGTATPVVPTISTQPATLVVLPGSAATLAIAASGSGPLFYQWSRNGAPVNGATGAVLHLSSVSSLDAGTYTVAVSNGAGSVGSSAAQLILVGTPGIAAQPTPASAVEGGAVTFTVAATGDALRYQWTRNQIAIVGATLASYTAPGLTLADSGAVYGVIVYNGAGLVFSQNAVLSVTPAPVSIGGSVSGLTGAGLVLQNNAGDNLAVAASGPFSFTPGVAPGSAYAVTVLSQPSGQSCAVQNGSGTASAAVSNVVVSCGASGSLALVTNYLGNSLSILRADATTGALTLLGSVATGANPYAVAVSPNGLYAYVGNLIGGSISAYAIDRASGSLAPIPSGSRVSNNPYGIAVDPLGRFLWVANYGFNTVSAFAIGPTGALAAVGAPLATGSLPRAVAVHPNGNFVYVAGEASHSITVYAVDAGTGALTLRPGTVPNSVLSPNAMVMHPNGSLAYVADGGSGAVAGFNVNASTGVLSVKGYTNTGSGTNAVAIHPSGQFLYVTTSSGVMLFAISATGSLSVVGAATPAGAVPQGLALDAAGTHLYVTDLVGGTVSAFSVDASTGALSPLAAALATGNQPSGIAISP
ncbi:MAG: beta-propeller fold lactonase family protein [Caldimonas sp.]